MKSEPPSSTPAGSPSPQARIDRLCADFAARLRSGQRPRIEDFLRTIDEKERPALLRTLLRLEVEHRARNGEVALPEEYIDRFPTDADTIRSVLEEMRPPGLAPVEPEAVNLQAGARPLPEYELVRKLGQGGFGEVWRARGPGGVDAALKFIRLADRGSALETRSLEVMKNIRHPNLVSVFGVWEKLGLLILAMELCDRTLQDRLKEALDQKLRGIPQRELLGYLRDAARGLDTLNAQNVQHRDVKPANLLLLHKGVKVADFGLAKVLEGTEASHTGAMSPFYTTPESFGGHVAKQSDQYSLGMTYYHLRTGSRLFQGSLAQVMHGHLTEKPNLAGLPSGEQAVLARALAKKPAERWPNCQTFVNELVKAYNAAQVKPAVKRVPTGQASTVPAAPSKQPRAVPSTAAQTADKSQATPCRAPTKAATASATAKQNQTVRPRRRGGRIALGIGIAVVLLAATIALWAGGAFQPKTTEPITAGPNTTAPAPTHRPAPGEPAWLTAPFIEQQAQEAQNAWAQYLGRKVEEEVDLGEGVKLVLVLIPPGTFTMGSPKNEIDHRPDDVAHSVTITKPFYLGKYAVTQQQYAQVMGNNPSFFGPDGDGKDRVQGQDTTQFPVESVTWEEADIFCYRVGQKAGWGKAGLPSEARWEYACRAGTTTAYFCGDDPKKLDEYAWYGAGNSNGTPHVVGGKKANRFGLYDMHGNVCQWCADYYGSYDGLGNENPERVNKGSDDARLVRGGSWRSNLGSCRAACRIRIPPGTRNYNFGLRVCFRLD